MVEASHCPFNSWTPRIFLTDRESNPVYRFCSRRSIYWTTDREIANILLLNFLKFFSLLYWLKISCSSHSLIIDSVLYIHSSLKEKGLTWQLSCYVLGCRGLIRIFFFKFLSNQRVALHFFREAMQKMRQSPYYPALTGNTAEQIKCFGRSK